MPHDGAGGWTGCGYPGARAYPARRNRGGADGNTHDEHAKSGHATWNHATDYEYNRESNEYDADAIRINTGRRDNPRVDVDNDRCGRHNEQLHAGHNSEQYIDPWSRDDSALPVCTAGQFRHNSRRGESDHAHFQYNFARHQWVESDEFVLLIIDDDFF